MKRHAVMHVRLRSVQPSCYCKIKRDHAGVVSAPQNLTRQFFSVGNSAHDRTCLSRADQNCQGEALEVLGRRQIGVAQRAAMSWTYASL
jgi:hypothetical protein